MTNGTAKKAASKRTRKAAPRRRMSQEPVSKEQEKALLDEGQALLENNKKGNSK